MGTTFSLPGQPANYIQVNEVGLKNCLANQTDKNIINNCINQNIVAPSNNTQIGVNPWNGTGLPPNPFCPAKQNSSPTFKSAPFGGNSSMTVNGATFGGNSSMMLIGGTFGGNLSAVSTFQNMDTFNMLNMNFNQNNVTLLIVIIVTLLIIFMTK